MADYIIDRGVRSTTPGAYHAHPALSRSIAHVLIKKTPAHAWTESPVLNKDYERKDSDAFDFGNVLHALMLGRGSDIVRVPSDRWNKAEKALRDEARASGKTAILASGFARAVRAKSVAEAYLAECGFKVPLDPEQSEQMAVAEIDGVTCRMMADHVLPWPTEPFLDIKTCEDASEAAIRRSIIAYGYDFQDQWYRETWRAATGEDRPFWFLFVEKHPPFACRLIELLRKPGDDADWSEDAAEKCAEARRIWRLCLETNSWPAYPAKRMLLGAPGYHRRDWAEAQTIAPDVSRETLARSADWQSPDGLEGAA